MDANESESEGSQHSLDEDLAIKELASSSSSQFKHQYPYDPVFVHDEDCEKDDDMAYFASIGTSNSKPALVKIVFCDAS
jgi:hypothetical protein